MSTASEPSTRDDDAAQELPRRRRRWPWAVGAVIAVLGAAAIAIPQLLRPDDPAVQGALPDNVEYGRIGWTPHGSLAGDAGFIRDAAQRLPRADDITYYLLWAGHGADGADGDADIAYFAAYADGDDDVLDLLTVRKHTNSGWDDNMGYFSSETPQGSFDNAIIPLDVDSVDGFSGDDGGRYYLVDDESEAGGVTPIGGKALEQHDGVVRVDADDIADGVNAFSVETKYGKAYTSPALTDRLLAGSWTDDKAKKLLNSLPLTPESDNSSGMLDEALVELLEPKPVDFDSGRGFVVSALTHHVETYDGEYPPNPRGERSYLIIVSPGADPVASGPAQDGIGRETHLDLYDDFAAPVPDGLPGGPAVVVSGGPATTDPDLPVIGKPAKEGGPVVYGDAPDTTAVVFHGGKDDPSGTALVRQTPYDPLDD
ncbi:hypothetical protein [Brevibacterium atlanticum]|uniref:hypothetical protein n=1 Tax=Brevibacterium atlanticum TaxID=2697563 RepID=UPI00141E0474|nr:hypothetical protein [Brevibacterium atlanticum]